MPSETALVAFALTSLLMILVPGPAVLFVVGRALTLGRRDGLLSVIGNELGALVLVAAVAVGVGGLVAQSVVVFTVVKLLGAAYLVHLGIQAIRARRAGGGLDVTPEARPRPSALVALRQGFVVGISNPKTIVFFIAILPQFVSLDAGPVPAQMLVLGLVFTLVALVSDAAWVLAASAARAWFATSERRMEALRATGGATMVGLGVSMAVSGRPS